MIVLGISGAVSHDPSAVRFVDREPVAAAEEERFLPDMFYGSQPQYLMMEDILICEQDTDAATGQ